MGNDVIHIMLADDDADDRLFFKEAIEEINIDSIITFVNDGSQLTNYLNQPGICLPDVLFLDINMPVKNGLECLREIRNNKRYNDILIVIYSTSGSDNDRKEAYDNGANVYLKKAGNFADLKANLANVLNDSLHLVTWV